MFALQRSDLSLRIFHSTWLYAADLKLLQKWSSPQWVGTISGFLRIGPIKSPVSGEFFYSQQGDEGFSLESYGLEAKNFKFKEHYRRLGPNQFSCHKGNSVSKLQIHNDRLWDPLSLLLATIAADKEALESKDEICPVLTGGKIQELRISVLQKGHTDIYKSSGKKVATLERVEDDYQLLIYQLNKIHPLSITIN
jgi:hypothetical protein